MHGIPKEVVMVGSICVLTYGVHVFCGHFGSASQLLALKRSDSTKLCACELVFDVFTFWVTAAQNLVLILLTLEK